MRISAQALCDDQEFKLGLRPLAGRAGLDTDIEQGRIQKPGLAIAGLVEAIVPGRVQVLGHTEMMYLESLDVAHQRDALLGLFHANIPAIIVSTGIAPLGTLVAMAEAEQMALLGTQLPSGLLIPRLHAFFDEHLSPRITLHGVLLDISGVGVLLTGHSGIGKSECALDLVLRGHRLIADDSVIVQQRDRELVGTGSPLTRYHMEVRGLGIINVRDLFGAASVCERHKVEMVVEMVEWDPKAHYDRTGLDDDFETILGVGILRIRLPLRPGRNVAAIVEVAARNFLLKLQGHHAAQQLESHFERTLISNPPRLP